jgi:hypothetical protein
MWRHGACPLPFNHSATELALTQASQHQIAGALFAGATTSAEVDVLAKMIDAQHETIELLRGQLEDVHQAR